MSQALILGCSHAAGSEMGLDLNWSHEDTVAYQLANSYPALLAVHLGYTVNNQAIPGGSNDAMFRIFESQLNKLTTNDIVIACWSGFERSEVYEDNTWIPIAPGFPVHDHTDNADILQYFKYWILCHSDQRMRSGRLNKIKNVLALNSLAQTHSIKVINVDSFWPVMDFAWPSTISWAFNKPFNDWAHENKSPHTKWGHFFEPTHIEFARLLADNLVHH